jgi:hypothetical protein
MFKRLFAWWRDGDAEIGRDGVQISTHPTVTYTGSICWNVRDILFYDEKKWTWIGAYMEKQLTCDVLESEIKDGYILGYKIKERSDGLWDAWTMRDSKCRNIVDDDARWEIESGR